MRFEFVDDDVLVLDGTAGVVHRITGDAAEQVRSARDEVSRRNLIKMTIATGVGVVTLALPSAAAAASGGGVGVLGSPQSDTLDAPINLQVTSTGNQSVSLSWSGVTGATSYTINYRKLGDSFYSTASVGSSLFGTVTGLENGTTYEFSVSAKAASKTDGTSSTVTAMPTAPVAPNAPSSVAASISGTTATVTWGAPSGGGAVDSYTLQWRLAGSPDEPGSYTTVSSSATSPSTVSGLTPGSSYVFRVIAVNTSGSASASTGSKYVANPPAAPNNFVAAPGISGGESVLSWEENTSAGTATSYTIQWKLTSAGSYADENTLTGVTGTTYTKTGLTPGETYDFRIRAVNADGSSSWVSDDSYVKNPPNAPQNVSATGGDSQATVTWDAPSGGGTVTSYKVEYRLASGTDADYAVFSSNATSPTTVTSLTGGQNYLFRVTAVNDDGSASAVSTSTAVTSAALKPGSFSVTAAVTGTSVDVSWGSPTPAATSYTLDYRHAGDSDTEANYTRVSSSATSPTTIGYLIPGTSYVFRVIATNSYGTRSASSTSTLVGNPPGNPVDVTATPSNGQVVLSWTAPTTGGTVTSYTIVRGIVGGSMTTTTGISAATTSQTYTGLTNGTSYQYTITAVGDDGSSSGVSVYAVPVTTNQTTFSSVGALAPITSITTSGTEASLTVDSGGTGYQYELDGASAVNVNAGSTTSISLSSDTHTLVVRKTLNGALVEATVVLNKTVMTASTSATTTLYIPNSPNGPRTISLDMYGGYGGDGGDDNKSGGTGGAGGRVSGTFAVLAGDKLDYAAGEGGPAGKSRVANTAGYAGGSNPMTGYNGGAGGKTGGSGSQQSGTGGSGGAASVVVRTSGATTKTFVAAGGGGGGGGGANTGGAGQTTHTAGPGGTDGEAGDNHASAQGPGGGGGGGGAVGGAGGSISGNSYVLGIQTNEGTAGGGSIGTNKTDSEAGLSAAVASGRNPSDDGTVTLTFYEVDSINATTSGQAADANLGALTPVSGTAPTAPGGVTALSGNKCVFVDWDTVSGATDYVLYYRRYGATNWSYLATTSNSQLAVFALANGTRWEFAVRTRRGSNTSALSATASATPTTLVTATPVSGATATLSTATFTLDNLQGCTYTYQVGAGAVTGATGTSSFTAALSGLSHTVVVTKGYFDGSAPVITTKTVTFAKITDYSGPTISANYGAREATLEVYGAKGGKGGNSSSGSYVGRDAGDPGYVVGTVALQVGDSYWCGAGTGGNSASANTPGAGGSNGGVSSNYLTFGLASASEYSGGQGLSGSDSAQGGGGGGGAASLVLRKRSGTWSVLVAAGGSGGGGGGCYTSTYSRGQSGQVGQAYSASKLATGTIGGSATSGGMQYEGGSGGGGGGHAKGGAKGYVSDYNPQSYTPANGSTFSYGGGAGGWQGQNTSNLDTTTTNSTKTGLSNGANGWATMTYYQVTGYA